MRNKIDLKGILTTVMGMIVFACTSVLMWASALEPSDAVLEGGFYLVLLLIGLAFGAFAAIVWFGWR